MKCKLHKKESIYNYFLEKKYNRVSHLGLILAYPLNTHSDSREGESVGSKHTSIVPGTQLGDTMDFDMDTDRISLS